MSNQKVFFQDFLFEGMPVDGQDFPIVEITQLPPSIDKNACIILSFDKMLKMNKPEEWDYLFGQVRDQNVCIVDDVSLVNPELEQIKRFYLYSYYFCLSKHGSHVYMMEQIKNGECKLFCVNPQDRC